MGQGIAVNALDGCGGGSRLGCFNAKKVSAFNDEEGAQALAARIADFSPVAVQSVKASVRMAMEAPLSAGLVYENEMNVLCFSAGDHLEGIRAFAEKRGAAFSR